MLGWGNHPYGEPSRRTPIPRRVDCEVCGQTAVNDGLCYQHFWEVMRGLADLEVAIVPYLAHWAEFREYEAVHA